MSTNALPKEPSPQPPNGLTPEQWQGLARLADLVTTLEPFTQGPPAAVAAQGITRLAGIYARYDIARLGEETLATLQALSDSGLLALLRDNADLLAQNVQLLAPLAEQLVARLKTVPFETLKADLNAIQRLLSALRTLADFIDEQGAGELAVAGARIGDFVEQAEPAATLRELFLTLNRLRINGTLAQIGEWSELLSHTAKELDWGQFVGRLTREAEELPWHKTGNLVKAVESALEQVDEIDEQPGGFVGLVSLMRDPEVQRGLRALTLVARKIREEEGH